jgi:hypothetical protein
MCVCMCELGQLIGCWDGGPDEVDARGVGARDDYIRRVYRAHRVVVVCEIGQSRVGSFAMLSSSVPTGDLDLCTPRAETSEPVAGGSLGSEQGSQLGDVLQSEACACG